MDKYKSYVRELDMVMTLLLNLSGRLARAENALRVESIPERQKVVFFCHCMGRLPQGFLLEFALLTVSVPPRVVYDNS